ncbi:MAG TPA: DUF4340 domain-containing protein [Candidatus Acidoferrales bacterium]|nr:DUF4340 domain-containing protein [Candidatus Acidoferrales bacterium]
MKKSTLVVLALAIALGAFVYFYDSKHNAATPSEEASWKTAFTVKADDITGLTLKSSSGNTALAKQGNSWMITQPVETRADQSTISGIVNDLSGLKIRRSFAPSDNLSKYGLDRPAITIEFQPKGGTKHTIMLGNKDFSGSVVYAQIDGGKDIDTLPVSLLDETTQPLSKLRDSAILDLDGADISDITLDDSSGKIGLAKQTSGWQITSPKQLVADSSVVSSFTSSISGGKFTDVASETANDLAKYGLLHPAITLDLSTVKGQKFQLLVGKKNADNNYYAHDPSRPMIFVVPSSLYDSINKTLFDFRDKTILHFDPTAITSVQVQNSNGTIECSQGKDGQWTIVQPVASKGKSVQDWKILDPIENARATKIYDSPTAAILQRLKKPAITISLTEKSGRTTTVEISAAAGDSVYARTSASPEVYELKTQILKDLDFKAADLIL